MKNIIKLQLIVLSILCFNPALKAQDHSKKIEELIEANVKSPGSFSGSILVAHKGEIIYRGAFGLADIKKGSKNTLDSKYFIGSITKQFTTVAILQLVEEKKLDLNDKLSKWLPEINGSDKITIHHLLTHQSGLRRDSHQDYDADVSYHERLFSIKNDTLLFEPEMKERYSSVGFYALSYILETVTGMKYETFFKEHIFSPSNMQNTGVKKIKSENIDGLSIGMDGVPDENGVNDLGYAKYFNSYSFAGGGSLYSTIDDMYNFFKALESGKLLSHNMVRIMKLKWPVKEIRKSRIYHSYGWEVYDYSNENGPFLMFDFAGKIYGYKSMIRYYENDDILVIALCNSNYSERSLLARNIRKILLNQEYDIPNSPKFIPITSSMRKHEGVYDFPSEKTTVEMKIINGKMTLSSHGDNPLYMYPEDENTFYSNLIPLKISFESTLKSKTQKLEFNYDDEMIATISRIAN